MSCVCAHLVMSCVCAHSVLCCAPATGGRQPQGTQHRKSAALTTFKALYPFAARNEDELSFEAEDLIEVSLSLRDSETLKHRGVSPPS